MNKLPSHNHLYAFIIKNYDKYGLELTSEKEMLALLNELEAYGATLSHLQGDLKSSFCNLFFDSLQNNAQVAKQILNTNQFYRSRELYIQKLAKDGIVGNEAYALASEKLIPTTDGFVEKSAQKSSSFYAENLI